MTSSIFRTKAEKRKFGRKVPPYVINLLTGIFIIGYNYDNYATKVYGAYQGKSKDGIGW